MEKNKNMRKGIVLVFSLVMLISFVAAININYPIEVLEKQLPIFPNEEKDITFKVDLTTNEGDTVDVTIVKGSEVISLIGSKSVKVGSGERVNVPFKVVAPQNAAIGSIHPVTIIFKSAGSAGTLGIGTSVGVNFNVKVVERPKAETVSTTTILLILLAIGIIILALIIFYLVKKKR